MRSGRRRRAAGRLALLAGAALLLAGCGLVTSGTPRRASPHAVVYAKLDGAPIVVEYGRPFRRGRTIFGGLVPYGRIWRTGADEATVLQTGLALRIGGVTLPAGRYSLWTRPGRRRWLVIINRQAGQWGTDYHASADLVRVPAVPVRLRRLVHEFTIRIRTRRQAGRLVLSWAHTRVVLPFRAAGTARSPVR